MNAQNDPVHDLWEDGKEVWQNGEYLTDVITRRAVEYIRAAARDDEPFFLFVAYNAPHYPMHAPARYVDRFPELAPDRRIMAAMLSAVDDGVGAVVAELERDNIRENTCIHFMSDNGPSRETRNWFDGCRDWYYGGTTGKLKGHKFSLYEGGIRVPGILNWPGVIPEGQVLDGMAAGMDIFPTFLKAAGGDPGAYELDGKDTLPMAAQAADTPHEELFFELQNQTAIRRGDWKLVLNGRLVEDAPPEDEVHLANLAEDMSESTNLKGIHPDITSDLRQAAENWRANIEQRWTEEWQPKANGPTTHS
jgi:arylsulfatase A-like enzyme